MRERDIFIAALPMSAPERAAYLASACGDDPELRRLVDELLTEHEREQTFFLDAPLPGVNVAIDHPSEKPGTIIGPYKLLQQIGEGGMGVVYMAEQAKPVERRVALKIIKPGMDTRQVIARFEAERQALAMMDHPNIAKVFEAGTTESGRPYFVMELVKGIPITRYCDEKHLSLKERLKLMLPVCQAIQHAHQKGIIHRDIKPTNVLVAQYDGRPVPKVIDFGVAKATAQKLTERTMFTELGQVVGTVEYMSPEQAELNQLDIDTRSDIYSLGVLLYELLTGTTPIDRQKLRSAAFHEMLRIIREDEPPKPSTSLSTSGTLASISANRQSDPARLSKAVRGELDWIVMKALEKDRNRRYETANGLASDIQRYLSDEAVQACPPSARYRFGKFARKNRATLTTAAIVALALLIGTAVSAWQAIRATNAETQARAKEVLAKASAAAERAAKQAETVQRRRAEASERTALNAVAAEKKAKETALAREAETKAALEFVEEKVFAAARPEGQAGGLGQGVTLRKAVEAALPFVASSFTDQPPIEARLRMTLGVSFSYLGDHKTAEVQFQAARALYSQHLAPDHPDTLASMHRLANSYSNLGRTAEALELREETLALMKAKLGDNHLDTLKCMRSLAISYRAAERYGDAFQLQEKVLALQKAKLGPNHLEVLVSMHNLALLHANLDRHAVAAKLFEEILAVKNDEIGPEHPDRLVTMECLAIAYSNLGRRDDAFKLLEEVVALQKAKVGPDHPHTLHSMDCLAVWYNDCSRAQEALPLLEEVLARRKITLGPNHPDTLHTMGFVAENLTYLGRSAEAVPIIDELVHRAAGQNVHPPRLIPDVMFKRLGHFKKLRDVPGCVETAAMWEDMKRTDAQSLYNAACFRAETAAVIQATDKTPSGEAQAKVQTDLALEWLKQAVAAGWKDTGRLQREKSTNALPWQDLQKLLAELQDIKPNAE